MKQIQGIMEIIYFDLETQHTFEELGMYSNRDKDASKLRMAIAGVLYNNNKHMFFGESQISQLFETLKKADIIIGHNLFRFDYMVLSQYSKADARNLFNKTKTFDMMHELEQYTGGCWTSLDDLCTRNIGICKTEDSSKIPGMWRNNQFKEIEEYLLNDLIMTRDIYEYIKKNKKVRYMHKEYGVEIGEREVEVIW